MTINANSIMVLKPYWHSDTWVFDDERVNLLREPFVCGIPEMIDKIVVNIPNARKGFRMLFAGKPFPGFDAKLVWRRSESEGNWYYSEQFKMEGWLCPALFKYFDKAPLELYVKAEPLNART